MFGFKTKKQYLFIIKYNSQIDEHIMKMMQKLSKTKLKSKSISKNIVELTFEIELNDNETKLLDSFKNIEGIENVSIISYQNDFGA